MKTFIYIKSLLVFLGAVPAHGKLVDSICRQKKCWQSKIDKYVKIQKSIFFIPNGAYYLSHEKLVFQVCGSNRKTVEYLVNLIYPEVLLSGFAFLYT